MPITSHRDSSQDLTTFVCYGDLSFYEIVVAMKCFYEGIDALPTKKLLWDLRNASIASLSVDQISNIASLSIEYEDMMKGGKILLWHQRTLILALQGFTKLIRPVYIEI